MRRRFSCLVFLVLLCAGPACQHPPCGLYETTAYEAVAYVERDGRKLLMDIVAPTDMPTARPAVIMIHGGSWAIGHRGWLRPMVDFLASMGYVAATIDYRLTTQGAVHPEPVLDVLAAVKFLRKNAAAYGIDPNRIALGGESAGGHLALLAGLGAGSDVFVDDTLPGVSSSVQAVIDIYSPTDLTVVGDAFSWTVAGDVRRYVGCPPSECPDLWQQASPITHVRPDAPPVLILHGEVDAIVPYSQAVKLRDAMGKVGAPCRLVRVAGGQHAWCLFFDGRTSLRTLPVMVQFLAEVFGPAGRHEPPERFSSRPIAAG